MSRLKTKQLEMLTAAARPGGTMGENWPAPTRVTLHKQGLIRHYPGNFYVATAAGKAALTRPDGKPPMAAKHRVRDRDSIERDLNRANRLLRAIMLSIAMREAIPESTLVEIHAHLEGGVK